MNRYFFFNTIPWLWNALPPTDLLLSRLWHFLSTYFFNVHTVDVLLLLFTPLNYHFQVLAINESQWWVLLSLFLLQWCSVFSLHFLPVAWGWGDPHITTLDGRRYTFNGWGEYVMLRANIGDFEFQGRTQLAANSNATIFSAFVIREGNDTVQVSC